MMRHERQGHGPDLVLIPGLAATGDFFAPAVAELSRDHRVTTVELPGHGGSPTGATEPTLEGTAEGLHALLAELDLREVTLVGWSLGATVAWTYLERFGTERIRALVSVEQTPWLLADGGWPYAAFGSLDSTAAAGLLGAVEQDPAGFAENLVRGSFADGGEPDPALVEPALVERLVARARTTDGAAIRGLLADVLRQDWRKRVGTIGAPTLLIHGSRSAVYPPGVADWLAGAIPAARVVLLERSGHLCLVEETDRFCAAIRDFLAATPGTATPGTATTETTER